MADLFEPRIIGFMCNWCAYGGADMAGTSRLKYPTNVDVIRVMCSGRIDPSFILKAFQLGADGVLVCGCHPGDCHYAEGNYKAARRIPVLKKLLEQFGIEPERLRLDWVSAAEGERFASIINEFTTQIQKLGHLPIKEELASGMKKQSVPELAVSVAGGGHHG
ncbi:MAG: hydrogenase iron-sulfur subunit [Dehalococcoidia bacterium]|nr:hydrogenase iron-sulfur subunit [Dehalococcoidia bacterium]